MIESTSGAPATRRETSGHPNAAQGGRNVFQWSLVLALLAVAVAYAVYLVFSQPLGLDEGYLMVTVQSFLDGAALYDNVFTQYGPVYYIYEWLLHRVVRIPLTHDATRWVCVVHWLAAAALTGCAGKVITRSSLGGIFAFMLAVVHLSPLTREAGHPQELIVLLVSAGVLAVTRGTGKHNFILLGLIASTLLFIKANIGIFFLAAVGMTAVLGSPRPSRASSIRTWLLIAGAVLLPFLLMRRHVMHDWCRNYALLTGLTIVASALTARDTLPEPRSWRHWWNGAAAFAIGCGLFAAVALLTGTSLHGLLDGLLLTPLKTPEIAILPFRVHDSAVIGAAVSVAFATFVSVSVPRRRKIVPVLKMLFVIASSLLVVGKAQLQAMYVLPWIWLIAVPDDTHNESSRVVRGFVALAAVWQVLQGYPIAGTQVAVGSHLVTLAAVICLVDVISHFRVMERVRGGYAGLSRFAFAVSRIAGAVLVVLLFALFWCRLPELRTYYHGLPRLNLRGSEFVRSDRPTVENYRAIAQYLEPNCDTFITCPGMNSFYFWTGKKPPTHINPTTLSLLRPEQQQHIVDALRRADRPLIVILESIVQNPGRRGAASIRILLSAIRDEYEEVHTIAPFKIYGRKAKSTPALNAADNPNH